MECLKLTQNNMKCSETRLAAKSFKIDLEIGSLHQELPSKPTSRDNKECMLLPSSWLLLWMGVVDGRLWMVACVQYQSWILVPMTLDQKIAVFNPNCGHWFKYIPNLFCKNNSKAILL